MNSRYARRLLIFAVAAVLAHSTAFAQAAAQTKPFEPQVGQPGKDVVWVPTPQALVEKMLDMAKLTPQDFHMDLGSGDGRTVITAAKRGARAEGIEYNPDMVALSQKAAQTAGVADKATFRKADIFETDFSKANVITLFLLPQLNMKLRPTILNMRPGTRIVSNTFTMEDWTPDETQTVGGDCVSWCTAHLWIVPAKVTGRVGRAGPRDADAQPDVPDAERHARIGAGVERTAAWRRGHLHCRRDDLRGQGERQHDDADRER